MPFLIICAIIIIVTIVMSEKIKKKLAKENPVPILPYIEANQSKITWVYRSKMKAGKYAISYIHRITIHLEDGTQKVFAFYTEQTTLNAYSQLISKLPNSSFGWDVQAFKDFRKDPISLRRRKFFTKEYDVGYRGFIFFDKYIRFVYRWRGMIKFIYGIVLGCFLFTRLLPYFAHLLTKEQLYLCFDYIDRDTTTFIFLGTTPFFLLILYNIRNYKKTLEK